MMTSQLGISQTRGQILKRWRRTLLFLALTGLNSSPIILGELYDTEGPHFMQEPSQVNYFTNEQGLLLHCEARGMPKPQVQWINQKDGQSLLSYSGIREIFSNGTIYFLPFPVSLYRPDVHDQTILCVATNSVGKIKSRDVHVKAIISQRYEVRVQDVFVQEGNDALLSCRIIPDSAKDFVSVTSWTKDESFNIFPHSGTGGRYFMTPSGELLIEEVTRNDSASTFRCRTVNRLSGETQLSENSARLEASFSGGSATKSKSDSPPRINPRLSTQQKLKLKEGDMAVLLCLSEGSPPPTHWWFRSSGIYGGLDSLRQSERIRVRKSAVIIENVSKEHAATYVCIVNNTAGMSRHQIELIVTSPLVVQVVPPVLTADIGKSAEFACWSNKPEDPFQSGAGTTRQIIWRKDGIEIRPGHRLSLSLAGDKLRIASVQREDKGMYQCFVNSDSDMAQGSAELRLGDAAPQLVYRFIEQTLQPGPAVSLKCSSMSSATFTWYLDGYPVTHSERLLIGQYVTPNGDVVSHVNITSSRIEDGGEWSCRATNKLGVSSHSARLNIYGPPFVRNMPASITAVAGKDFQIKCPVAGYPILSIIWEKDGQTLPMMRRQLVSADGTLTIKSVDRSVDFGHYSCIARNNQGESDRKGFQLKIVVPPKLVPLNFPATVNEGEKLFASCVVTEGDPPMRLKWLKNSQIIGDTSPNNFEETGVGTQLTSLLRSGITTHRIGDSDALVLQINHVMMSHSGNWTCFAKNNAGETIQTATLTVHVGPKIAPFFFPSQVSQGSRVQSVCSVEQTEIEETDLTVTWFKNSEPLVGGTRFPFASSASHSKSNVKIVHVDAYSAMLIIDRVESSDSGNYSCVIKNSVDEVSKTVPLIVQVPPKWVVEPSDFETLEKNPVSVPCITEGLPSPTTSWKRMANRPENYRDIPVQSVPANIGFLHQPGISALSEDPFSLPNGTLIIRSPNKAHEGLYLCESTNGIGTGLSKVIRLVINVPVHIRESMQNVSSRISGKAILRCEITGDGPILEVGWKRDLVEINPKTNSRYHIRTLNGTQGTFTELTINNVTRDDRGARFNCYAVNSHGRSQASVYLYVQEPPEKPRNLHVISKQSRFVRLGWILSQDGHSAVTRFIIKYKVESGNSDEYHQITVPGNIFSETVGNLRPAKKYAFVVIAENQVGQSEHSEVLEAKTDGEVPEGRPRNVRVASVSSSDIQVTWDHPEKDTWHGELLGYYVGRRREGEQYQFSTIERRDGLQEYRVKGLLAFTSYEIVVQAYNGIGAGPLADPVVATTLEDVPSSPPEAPQCRGGRTSEQLELNWSPLSQEQARGIIKGYKVFLERTDFDLVEEGSEPPLMKTTISTNLVVGGLAKYRNYSVQVQAFTIAGEGPLSFPIFCHTNEDVPDSPAAIKTIVTSPSSITVIWLPPSEPNGQITRYTVYIASQDGGGDKGKDIIKRKRQVSPDVTKFQFDGLRVEEKYEVRVTASTRIGEGSHAISRKTLTKNVQSAIASFGMRFRIVWKTDVRLPCETIGSPTIQWTRYGENVRNSDRVSVTQDGSLLIKKAQKHDSANYSCSIHDSKGHVLDSIMHMLLVQVPPGPPLLTAAVNSHTVINLQWKLSDSGNAPVQAYILHFKAGEEWIEERISRRVNSYELRDLECGRAYQMYLTAYNRAGMGHASDLVNVSTLGYPPSLSLVVPQFMVETNQSWARVLLRDIWSTNGCPIRKFQVLYKEAGTSHWQAVGAELVGESHSADIVGLKGGATYHLKIIATNSAGSSQTEVTINTPPSQGGPETSDKVMNYEAPLYLDVRLIVPLITSLFVIALAAAGICFCLRKKAPIAYRSTDHLSIGTSSSSTYFKQIPRANQPQQVYMTVKKSTPMKGVDVTDLDPIPQYADDIYPYATFELNENRRDSTSKTYGSIPTLDRRRSSSQGPQWNQMCQESNRVGKVSRTPVKREESDGEYDAYGSDTDTEQDMHPGANRSSIQTPTRLNSKFQDYNSHARPGNRYEFVPPTSAIMKTREMQNEIHGMVMADPYAFNDAFPTMDNTKRRKPNRGRKRSQGRIEHHQQSSFLDPQFSGLDPPYGFKDGGDGTSQQKHGGSRKGNPTNEYAIAV